MFPSNSGGEGGGGVDIGAGVDAGGDAVGIAGEVAVGGGGVVEPTAGTGSEVTENDST